MKKVLITGANSYIGCHVENWLKSRDGEYEVHTADLKTKTGRNSLLPDTIPFFMWRELPMFRQTPN